MDMQRNKLQRVDMDAMENIADKFTRAGTHGRALVSPDLTHSNAACPTLSVGPLLNPFSQHIDVL